MILKKLAFSGFRNLDDGVIEPCENINIIYGENAQGKTNILEALWIISGLRSFRGAKDRELIGFSKNMASVKAEFFKEERKQEIEIKFISGKKEVYLNGVKKTSPSDIFGKFPVVVFSPEHLTLVKNGPKERRLFVDSAISGLRPAYGVLLRQYNKALMQKNSIYKSEYKKGLCDILDIWDEKLAEIGGRIIYQRMQYINTLSKIAREYHLGISGNREELSLEYSTIQGVNVENDSKTICKELYKFLCEKRNDEIKLGFANYGPQRDDMEIYLNGKKARVYASQGQQRSIVLSIKLAEGQVSEIKNSDRPVFLLDDVLSELDYSRQDYLLNKLKDKQVFISTCDLSVIENLKGGNLFFVEQGKVKQEKGSEK